MTAALKIVDGGSLADRSRPGECSARHAAFPAVDVPRNPVNNCAQVLPVPVATGSLTADPTRTSGRSSTSGESHSTTGEQGGRVAHVPSATPSPKTRAASRPGLTALTPTDSDSTREVRHGR